MVCHLGPRKIMLVGLGTDVPEKISPTTLLKSLEIVENTILLARLKLNQRYVDKPVLRMVFQ